MTSSIQRRYCGLDPRLMWFIGTLLPVTIGVAAMAQTPDTPATSREGLLLEYDFDGNATDRSGARRDGQVHGNAVYVAGRKGPCFSFDGQTHVDTGLADSALGPEFTVECWVNPADTQSPYADIFGNHAHGGRGFVMEQGPEGQNTYNVSCGAGSHRWMTSEAVALTPGTWQHVALIKTRDELRFCLNGLVVAVVADRSPMASSPVNLRIGWSIDEPSRRFRGLIDEVRVWRRAITRFDHAAIPPERAAETLANHLRVKARQIVDKDVIARCGPPTFDLSVDERLASALPSGLAEIPIALEAEWSDFQGTARSTSLLPPVILQRASGFRAKFTPPADLKPGYWWVRCGSQIAGAERRLSRLPTVFSFVIHPRIVPATPIAPDRPAVATEAVELTRTLSLDGDMWRLAIDPKNVGRQEGWFNEPRKDAKPTKVPWILQDAFPNYHGVVWYWRRLEAPANPHEGGRTLLRFNAVSYMANVWLNGRPVGEHEGAETPFMLDVTDAIKPGAENLLAVRVLNPTYEPIDGISLYEVAKSLNHYPVQPNASYNAGGIHRSVEVLLAPTVRIEDVQSIPDWKTGEVRVRVNLRNAGPKDAVARLSISVAPAARGTTIAAKTFEQPLVPGDTLVEAVFRVPSHRLWELNDPYLYRVTARVEAVGSRSADEQSVRFGFRDFRYDNGFFRLNGKRVFLQGPMNQILYPAGYLLPHDPDLLRRDVMNMKTFGFNFCRVAFSSSTPEQLDLCDEVGLLIVQGHLADWQLDWHTKEYPNIEKRFDRSIVEQIRRDRNHPCIIAWGHMNETSDGRLFRHGVDALSLVRTLDEHRMLLLNSGRFDNAWTFGSASNPGSWTWDAPVRDLHDYPNVPHTADILRRLRGVGSNPSEAPIVMTEYGQCSGQNYPRLLRQFEQIGKAHGDDADYFRKKWAQCEADWKAWRLDECWARPEDFFVASQANVARLRLVGSNAILANPKVVGHALWNALTDTYHGCGLTTLFRELKPTITDVATDLGAPLRWCLFVEPVNVYRGGTVRLEAVLANHDALRPGKYPVRVQVVGPKTQRLLDKMISVEVPAGDGKTEPPFAFQAFAEDLRLDGPSGQYRFIATFTQGAAAAGEGVEFYATDPADMPAVSQEVTRWGEDPELDQWLKAHGIRTRPFAAGEPPANRVILACGKPPAPGGQAVFAELTRCMSAGSTVVFLDLVTLAEGGQPMRWSPVEPKGSIGDINVVGGFYRKDDWAKDHPIFAGLPAGGIMDYTFYREIIPVTVMTGLPTPAEAVCGAIRTSGGVDTNSYASGLHIAIYKLGTGRCILNNLRVRENLGKDPVAERLLRNLLNTAASPSGV